jgi:hypothetical protein
MRTHQSDNSANGFGQEAGEVIMRSLEILDEFANCLPAHFVASATGIWPEIHAGDIGAIDDSVIAARTAGSEAGWVVRTFVHLAQAGYPASIGTRTRADVVNVVSPRDFGRRQRPMDRFVLVPRADGHCPMLANFICVQSPAAPIRAGRAFIPYWPQAGIRPRRHEGREGITKIGFRGRLLNLEAEFRSPPFLEALAQRGIRFDYDKFEGLLVDHDWGDYSDLDAVVAVRNLTLADALHKPASKLVNAWFGEVPAILGPEPAFRALRRSPLDYLEVTTPEEALGAVDRLRTSPDLYEKMVRNGRERRKEYTVDSIRRRWIDVLESDVRPFFEMWRRQPIPLKIVQWLYMCAAEPASKAYYHRAIRRGPRLLGSA